MPIAGNGYEMKAIAACVLGGISLSGGVGSLRYERNTYNLDFDNDNTTDKSVPLTYEKSMLSNFYTPSI